MINTLSRYFYRGSLGALLIRIVAGAIFIEHGFIKWQSYPLAQGFFVHLGFPSWVAGLIIVLEMLGGAMLMLGVATRAAGAVLGIEMLAAVFLTGVGAGLGRHDLELLLMAVSFGIALMGSGQFSLYKMECDKCGGMLCNGKAGCPEQS